LSVREEDKDVLYRVAYEEAVRALSRQMALLESFRSRAGILLSSTALTTSFVGSRTFDGSNLSPFGWLALIAFVGVGSISLAVLRPRAWEFSADSRDVVETYIEGERPAQIDVIHRDLAIHMHKSCVVNRVGLERLALLLQIAGGLLTIEVGSWILVIATGA
jgi:hypothetical protein